MYEHLTGTNICPVGILKKERENSGSGYSHDCGYDHINASDYNDVFVSEEVTIIRLR